MFKVIGVIGSTIIGGVILMAQISVENATTNFQSWLNLIDYQPKWASWQYIDNTLTFTSIAIVVFFGFYYYRSSKGAAENEKYAQAVGFLWGDMLKNKKKEIATEQIAPPSRAYECYCQLDNYVNTLPSDNRIAIKIKEFLSYFKVSVLEQRGVIYTTSVKLKRKPPVDKIEKLVNYLKKNL